jgi:hypothetical protein
MEDKEDKQNNQMIIDISLQDNFDKKNEVKLFVVQVDKEKEKHYLTNHN